MRWTVICVLLASAGCRSTCPAPGGKVDRLIAQLEGRCCEFSAEGDTCRELGLAEVLRHPESQCLRAAAVCLAGMGAEAAPAVPALIEAVRHGPDNFDTGDGVIHVRDAAIEALGQTADPRAVGPVLEALENPRSPPAASATVAALRALESLGPLAKQAVPAILPFLKGAELRIVDAAVRALAAIGDPAAAPALVALLEQSPDRPGERTMRRAIRKIAGPAALAALPPAYEDMRTLITALVRRAARAKGLPLRLHVDGPREQTTAALPSGAIVFVRFRRDDWLAGRIVKGAAGRMGEERTFTGLAELERILNDQFARP